MLFDISSPGRKRVVRLVFGSLALMFAASFLFFGIGSSADGGLADLFGFGNDSADQSLLGSDIDDLEKQRSEDPANRELLLELAVDYQALARQRLQEGGDGVEQDVLDAYRGSIGAWEDYLATDPQKLDTAVGRQVVGQTGPYTALFVTAQRPSEYALQQKAALKTATLVAEAEPVANNLGNQALWLILGGKEKQAKPVEQAALKDADPAAVPGYKAFFKQAGAYYKTVEQASKEQAKQEQAGQGAGGILSPIDPNATPGDNPFAPGAPALPTP